MDGTLVSPDDGIDDAGPSIDRAVTLRGGLHAAVVAGTFGVLLASLLGLAGAWWWFFDLMAHFRVQYLALALLGGGAAAAMRSWRIVGTAGLVVLLNAVMVLPLVLPTDQPLGEGMDLRLVQFNVLRENNNVEGTADWLTAQNADVIVAQEANQRWADGLDLSLRGWTRIEIDSLRPDSFGMAIYVRDGVAVDARLIQNTADVPLIQLRLAAGDQTLLVHALHTLPPTRRADFEDSLMLAELTRDLINAHKGPTVVIGDLNATRWSALLRPLLNGTDLRDSAEGFGLGGTWPSSLWFTGMVGIDHVLVGPEIRVRDRFRGPDLGSDHRPLVVDLTVVAN